MSESMQSSLAKRISVILRTRTTERTVFEAIASLADQATAPLEFVVVDSGSASPVLDKLARMSVETVPRRGSASPAAAGIPLHLLKIAPQVYQSSRALNFAIGESRGDLLAILSQDAVPADRFYLGRLSRWFDQGNVAGVYGRQIPRGTCSPLVEKDLLKSYPAESRTQLAPDCWFANTCSMIRRDLWSRHPFDEKACISEDHEWAKWFQDRGYVVGYEARAIVLHHHQYGDLRAVWNRFCLEGRGLAHVHSHCRGLVRTAADCVREVGSDAVWLVRERRGLVHWLPELPRRLVKHAALYWGSRSSRNWGVNGTTSTSA